MARLLRPRRAPLFILTLGKVRMVQGCFQLSFALQSALGMPLRMRGQEQNLFYAVIAPFSQFVPERSHTPASLQ
jgi:hypothetical protein